MSRRHKGERWPVLDVVAPWDSRIAGAEFAPEGDRGRCFDCGQRIQWAAVVETPEGQRFAGLTCAGVRPDVAMRRRKAAGVLRDEPFMAWAATRPHPSRHRAGETLAHYMRWAAVHAPRKAVDTWARAFGLLGGDAATRALAAAEGGPHRTADFAEYDTKPRPAAVDVVATVLAELVQPEAITDHAATVAHLKAAAAEPGADAAALGRLLDRVSAGATDHSRWEQTWRREADSEWHRPEVRAHWTAVLAALDTAPQETP